MGTLILIVAAVIEIFLGALCFVTKSSQKSIRSWVRIGSLAVFIIFSIVSVVQWSFRWYLLALVLLILAIIGGVSLIRRKEDNIAFRPVGFVIKGIAIWLVIFIASIPALVFPQYNPPEVTGKYKVDTAYYTYTDNNRMETLGNSGKNREVNVEFWYPENSKGKFPLVVFSHGAFGIKTSNSSAFNELASNGYVVCSIDHPYHSFLTKNAIGKITIIDWSFMKEINDLSSGVYDEQTEFNITHKWLKLRTDDMNLVLDTIISNAKGKSADETYKLIDTDKIGLFGHSLGGATSAEIGRERHDIDAVIDIDGSLIGEQTGFANGKCTFNKEKYPTPILFINTDAMMQAIASTEKAYPGIELPEKVIPATSPNAFEAYFKGTNHMSVTGLSIISPFLVDVITGTFKNNGGAQAADKYYVINKMNSLVLQFFNSYVKGEGKFHCETQY